jgi:hypothetical protein
MDSTLLFGGHEDLPSSEPDYGPFRELYELLSWKYVTPDATFALGEDLDRQKIDAPHAYRKSIADWAGRIWFHQNEMPTGADLRAFDLMTLEPEFRRWIARHGQGLFERGMSVEEIWGSQQLYSAKPMTVILSDHYADQATARLGKQKHIDRSDSLVWLLATMLLRLQVTRPGINVLVTDGSTGHTISLSGLHGVPFQHPRGDLVRAGWFSFHDPWPARSLLAPERGFGVRALEDVSRPPYWLISPDELDKIVVGFLIPVDTLSSLRGDLALLDFAIGLHKHNGLPLWLEDENEPDQPLSLLLTDTKGLTPTTARSLHGLARIDAYFDDLAHAESLLEAAFRLDRQGTIEYAVRMFSSLGHHGLAQKWGRKA